MTLEGFVGTRASLAASLRRFDELLLPTDWDFHHIVDNRLQGLTREGKKTLQTKLAELSGSVEVRGQRSEWAAWMIFTLSSYLGVVKNQIRSRCA